MNSLNISALQRNRDAIVSDLVVNDVIDKLISKLVINEEDKGLIDKEVVIDDKTIYLIDQHLHLYDWYLRYFIKVKAKRFIKNNLFLYFVGIFAFFKEFFNLTKLF